MWTKKDVIIFFAGAMAFHTLSHIMLHFATILPLTFWGIVLTSGLNMYAIVISALITIALLWWAARIK